MLAEHLHVIRWDQRGSGRSERRGPYSVAQSLADLDAVRSQLKDRDRTEAEDRELAILQWSAEFAATATATATARHNAEQMATPWFGINHECNAAINNSTPATCPGSKYPTSSPPCSWITYAAQKSPGRI